MLKSALSASLLVLVACSSEPAPDPFVPTAEVKVPTPPSPPPTDEELRARISEYVFDAYDRTNFPKLYKRLGKPDPTQRIQAIREGASFQALRTGKCDFVELTEISDARSSNDNLVVFVDCRNRERFYISERDLVSQLAAVANSERTLPRVQALEACVEAARAAATFPSLVAPHIWTGASYTTYKTMGSARVILDFDATNALGVELSYTANCLFPAGSSIPELTVTPR